MTSADQHAQWGLQQCLDRPPAVVQDGRFGLLMNQASVDAALNLSCDVLAKRFPGQLRALFSPQHGLWGEQQANMIESRHDVYPPLGVPIYSLYSETRKPRSDWLSDLDCLVVDLQDVGTRVYTFAWTVTHCLEACAEAGIPLLILDRPNPLGGQTEGPRLESGWESFVGRVTIPLRHGLTLGELAGLANRDLEIGADLHVVTMSAWDRQQPWSGSGAWVPPSPNIPQFATAVVYPGQVLLEGTNLSEGRGTTRPFEVIGAPYVDAFQLIDALADWQLPGVHCVPTRFRPTFDKWANQVCGGVALQVHDVAAFQPVHTTISLLACIHRLWPDAFAWLPPPYEYETEKLPIDILFGSDRLRSRLASGDVHSDADVASLLALDTRAWREDVANILLYP